VEGRLNVFIAAAVLVAGCGGSSHKTKTTAAPKPPARIWPRPVESAQQAAERIGRADRQRDCSSPRQLMAVPKGSRILCGALLRSIDFPPRPNVKTFGSAAIVEQADGGHAILALDSDRRYKIANTFGAPGLPPVPVEMADEWMARTVAAIRRDSCDEIFALSISPTGDKRFCSAPEVRQLHAALDRAYTASPTPLGGDGRFAFYGLRVKPYYYTLIFVADRRDTYAFVTSIRA
jgi:hypothetical protein